jgi:hypothetical protein
MNASVTTGPSPTRRAILPPGQGRGWHAHWQRIGGVWVIDTRRACGVCTKSYRDCACGDSRPCPLDAAVG